MISGDDHYSSEREREGMANDPVLSTAADEAQASQQELIIREGFLSFL